MRDAPRYPRGPWLRAEFCCLGPSSLTTTPSASLAGTRATSRVAAYTRGLRCAGAPRRPTRPSLLSLARCPHVPPTLPRWVRCASPVVHGQRYQAPSNYERVATHGPASASNPRRGSLSRLHRSRHAAARAFARPSWLATTMRRSPRLLRYRVTPAFGPARRRPGLGVRLDGRTGNLPSSGLSPD